MAKPQYQGKPWLDMRRFILERDGYVCQLKYTGCKVRANAVDHIVSVSRGGAWYDPANLQAACTSCNTTKANKARAMRRKEAARHLPPDPTSFNW